MNVTDIQLRRYNQLLLTLFTPSVEVDPDEWLLTAVQAFKTLVNFDSAWWGQVRPAHDSQAAKSCMHGSIGLGSDFASQWNRLSGCDDFAQESMNQLGCVIVHNFSPEAASRIDPEVLDFCAEYGIHHSMAITLSFPNSGLQFFLSMNRGEGQPGFSSEDAFWLEQYGQHLLNGWIQRLQPIYHHTPTQLWREQALVSPEGRLIFIGSQLSRLLDDYYQEWQGSQLPGALVQALSQRRQRSTLGSRSELMAQPCGRLTRLSLVNNGDTGLSPRELKAAWCYAEGQSYKEVARALGVTPATVRTYLQHAYQQLKVKNKVELHNALEKL